MSSSGTTSIADESDRPAVGGATQRSYDVVVVGGGIAGLGAAHRLRKAGLTVLVLDAGAEAGGRMRSTYWGGAWIDIGGEFISHSARNPGWFADLASDVGIPASDILRTGSSIRFDVWKNGRSRHVNLGKPTSLALSSAITSWDKLTLPRLLPTMLRQNRRLTGEWTPQDAAWIDDESIETWLRHSSRGVLEYVFEPIWSQFCGWEPADISKGMLMYLQSIVSAYDAMSTFRQGLGQLTRAVAEHLEVSTSSVVREVSLANGGSTITFEREGRLRSVRASHVVMAVQGTHVNSLVPGLDQQRHEFFAGVRYVPHDQAHFRLSATPAGVPSSGLGLLYPRNEEQRLQTVGYCPTSTDPDVRFFRAAVKPRLERAWQDLSDEQYLGNLLAEVARYHPEIPALVEDSHLTRWSEALPTFHPGYLRSLDRFAALGDLRGISFCGDYLGGPATSAAYATGQRAAASALRSLGVSSR